jgi:hypothetical protein
MKLPLFDPREIPQDFIIAAYGRKNTGKTTWMEWFLSSRFPQYDDVIIFSSTAFTGRLARLVENKAKVVQGFDDERLGRLIEFMQRVREADIEWHTLVIMDDVHDVKLDIRRSANLSRIFTMCKWLRCSLFVNCHDASLLTPAMRNNIDAAVMFKSSSFRHKQTLWHIYGGNIPWKEFLAMLTKYTENYKVLINMICKNTDDCNEIFRYSRAGKLTSKILFRDTPLPQEKSQLLIAAPQTNAELSDLKVCFFVSNFF